jgi:pantetheine-phosphate adenylyltransferase
MSELTPQVRRAVCPGSFDPVTNGHLDIIDPTSRSTTRSVAIFVNQAKSMFSVEERREMLVEATETYPNVRIGTFHGLVVRLLPGQ